MKVETKGHTITIKDTKNNIVAFIENISKEYKTFKEKNLILDVSSNKSITLNDLINLKSIAKQHKKAKRSMIIVADDIDFNDAPIYLTIVPSILEAHDIIEMEEIERDLGF